MSDFALIREALLPSVDEVAGILLPDRSPDPGWPAREAALAAVDRVEAEMLDKNRIAVEAQNERDEWRTLAEGWKLTDDVERHRV